MSQQIGIYDTATLVKVVPNLKTSQNWLLDRFFPDIVESIDEHVAIDILIGQRRLAPFCSPMVSGKLVESLGQHTKLFKPPYIKDKRAPDLRRPIKRQVGERIGGELSPAEREQFNLMSELADQIDMINRRLEWMAASALQTATITVSGEGYPTTVINFGRASSLTIALSGSDKWKTSVVKDEIYTKPTDDIEKWQSQMLKEEGVSATDIVFTNESWAAFKLDTSLKESAIVMPALSPYGNQVDPGPRVKKGAVYKGRWGQYDLWVYNDWFIDPLDRVEKPMLSPGNLIMSGPDLEGIRAFASIIDPDFSYGPMAYAPKVWTEKDPAQRYVMMQSSPLVIPSRVNASLCAKVV
ncbi:MAG: major capsid protein [Enterobacteriaceae bacterium]